MSNKLKTFTVFKYIFHILEHLAAKKRIEKITFFYRFEWCRKENQKEKRKHKARTAKFVGKKNNELKSKGLTKQLIMLTDIRMRSLIHHYEDIIKTQNKKAKGYIGKQEEFLKNV